MHIHTHTHTPILLDFIGRLQASALQRHALAHQGLFPHKHKYIGGFAATHHIRNEVQVQVQTSIWHLTCVVIARYRHPCIV